MIYRGGLRLPRGIIQPGLAEEMQSIPISFTEEELVPIQVQIPSLRLTSSGLRW